MSVTLPKSLKPVVDLAIQVAVGAVGFIAILLVAVLLAGVVKLLGALWFAPAWLGPTADAIERAIFWFDVVCLVLFLTAEAIKFIKGLWKEVIQP
jgi:hypothetical protein